MVLDWLRAGRLQLPLPGTGRTLKRWLCLAELTEVDVVAGRLAEAHADAVAMLDELGGPAPRRDHLWAGVGRRSTRRVCGGPQGR